MTFDPIVARTIQTYLYRYINFHNPSVASLAHPNLFVSMYLFYLGEIPLV